MSRMEPEDGGGGPEAKRKKSYSRREIFEKLEECENDVKNTLNNFMDCYNHMWDRSRPTILAMEREIRPKKSKVLISTEIEALVETLFLEE